MDEMQEWEAQSIITNLRYVDRNDREMRRMELFVNIQSNSKNKLKMEDILKLPWDDENKNTGTKITEEQQKELRERAAKIANHIQQVTKFENADMSNYLTDNRL